MSIQTSTRKIVAKDLQYLTNMELLILASEVNATGDTEFLDKITDEIKRRKWV
jgi:hypothetical protein